MSRNRFVDIMMVIHFNDNNIMQETNSPTYNKCHKIQPLIDHFRHVFKDTVTPETHMSVDEQVIPLSP